MEETIEEIKEELQNTRLSLNLFRTFLWAFAMAVAAFSYIWLNMLAAIGGAKVSEQYGEIGQNLLLASYKLSLLVIGILLFIFFGLWLLYIWNNEIQIVIEKVPTAITGAIRGARKELREQKNQKPDQTK